MRNGWKVGDKARYKNSFDVQITHVSKYCFIGKAGNEGEAYGLLGDLTPIKSSEQIERKRKVKEMSEVCRNANNGVFGSTALETIEALIEAGYHNQPKVKELSLKEYKGMFLGYSDEHAFNYLVSGNYIIEKKEQDND